MNSSRAITLAFDSAIAGGSISLLDRADEIAYLVGASEVSKAEDLLSNIDSMLHENELIRQDIASIAVSAGPGSFTGIRIGLATALGLKNGLGVSMTSVSALATIAAATKTKDVIVAIPMGRRSVCLQRFDDARSFAPPFTLDDDTFIKHIQDDEQNSYIVHEKLYTTQIALSHVTNFGSNVALAIGLFALQNPEQSVEPLFISKNAQ